jgi:peptidoglycan/xylan/chitin deacetylase (PgdA/CDA1 family)
MNPISIAIEGKGALSFLRRGVSIARRYGMTPNRMHRALAQFAAILRQFGCSATFPVTAVTMARNSAMIEKYQAWDIEFAVHGYRHVDHSQLAQTEQLVYLAQARQVFAKAGMLPGGFRGPYLRWNPDTLAALRQQGFAYDSSQGLAWDVIDGHGTLAYRRALDFYGARSASDYPSLPFLEENLVRIPYSLPDDEALVERLALETTEQMGALWLDVLHRTHELGELFTLGLHPERIAVCREPLAGVLAKARVLTPAVWIARLDEIATWWRARAEAVAKITDAGDGGFHLVVAGPSGTTVLARAVKVDAPAVPWADGYRQVEATTLTIRAPCRPFIGVSPGTSLALTDFLHQQGYIVETSEESHRYSYYFDQTEFTVEHERPLLAQIEGTDRPLVRLGRWPDGACSALAVTGDIDAITLCDYGLRYLGY